MSNWQVGDLALCLKQTSWRFSGLKGPKAGSVHLVAEVVFDPRGNVGLIFDAIKSRGYLGAWNARSFRKITPGADIEGIEEPRRASVWEDA